MSAEAEREIEGAEREIMRLTNALAEADADRLQKQAEIDRLAARERGGAVSEYTATIEVYRSARGEGDKPVLMVAASGIVNGPKPPPDAMRDAVAEAMLVIDAALTSMGE